MNLFAVGTQSTRVESTRRRDVDTMTTAKYEKKLAEYREILERYKNCILEYAGKLEGFDRRTIDNQLSIVQTALDLTYIKEQGDKTMEVLEDMRTLQASKVLMQMENLTAAIVDTNYKLEGLDKDVVNRLYEIVAELQKQTIYQYRELQTGLVDHINRVEKKVKGSKAMIGFLLFLSILEFGGLAFIILYLLEIISF